MTQDPADIVVLSRGKQEQVAGRGNQVGGLTGIAADARRSPAATTARRTLAVVTMFAGALGGALLALHTTLAWALTPAVLALAVVVAVATAASRQPAGWHNHDASPGPARR